MAAAPAKPEPSTKSKAAPAPKKVEDDSDDEEDSDEDDSDDAAEFGVSHKLFTLPWLIYELIYWFILDKKLDYLFIFPVWLLL